jgi:hypothetical protein
MFQNFILNAGAIASEAPSSGTASLIVCWMASLVPKLPLTIAA